MLFRVPVPTWLAYGISFLETYAILSVRFSAWLSIIGSIAEVLCLTFLLPASQRKRLLGPRQSNLTFNVFAAAPLVVLLMTRNAYFLGPIAALVVLAALLTAAASGNPLIGFLDLAILYAPFLAVATGAEFLLLVALILVGSISALQIMHAIDKKLFSSLGVKATSLGISFFRAWFNKHDPEYEELLKNISSQSKIKTVIASFFSIDGTSLLGSLVISDAHPGPFHEVGSSMLPKIISDEFERQTGAPCVVLRGVGGHENDMPSRADATAFASALASSAKTFAKEGLLSKVDVSQSKAGNFTLTHLDFGVQSAFILSKAPQPCDDIPEEVAARLEGTIKNCKLSDAHNSGPDDGKSTLSYFPESDVEAIQSSIKSWQSVTRGFSAGFSHIDLPSSLQTGICDGGVAAISISNEAGSAVLVSFQGNNMIRGLRDKIISELRKAGFSTAEVATTDNHQLSTSLKSVNSYTMVGGSNPEEVLRLALDAANQARSSERPAAVAVQEVTQDVRVVGAEGLNKLNASIKSGVLILEKLLAAWTIACLLLVAITLA